jgi:phosphotransferase system HPr-like phosphotransfer protein
LADAIAATEDGRIADAKSIVGLLRLDRLRRAE